MEPIKRYKEKGHKNVIWISWTRRGLICYMKLLLLLLLWESIYWMKRKGKIRTQNHCRLGNVVSTWSCLLVPLWYFNDWVIVYTSHYLASCLQMLVAAIDSPVTKKYFMSWAAFHEMVLFCIVKLCRCFNCEVIRPRLTPCLDQKGNIHPLTIPG